MGLGPNVVGWWSISTDMLKEMTVFPGHESLLKASLLFMIEAGAGKVWRISWVPHSPSALMAHLRLTPLGNLASPRL